MTEDPFFEHWTTPFGIPPFDRIRPEHFPPAFDRGMKEEIAEIAAERGIPLRLRNMRGMVRTNPKLLATATRSLLLNAIKFGTGEGIIACCRRRGSQLRLEVHFAGTSFDAAIQRSAFVQLLPTDDRPIATELGLGVSLLEYLCRQLGHSLYYTKSSPNAQQLLAIELSLATASS